MIYSPDQLKKLHNNSMFNKHKIAATGQLCGCFCCLEVFDSKEIKEWTDRKRTALCPHCGIDSVLATTDEYPVNNDLLEQMQKRWFSALSEKDFDFIPIKPVE